MDNKGKVFIGLIFLIIISVNIALLTIQIVAYVKGEHQLEYGGITKTIVLSSMMIICFWTITAILLGRNQRKELSSLQRKYDTLSLKSGDMKLETQVLEAITRVSEVFLDRIELNSILDQILDSVQKILKVDISVMALFDEKTASPTMQRFKGVGDVKLGEELYNDVIFRGKSLLINNISHYPKYHILSEEGFKSMIVAPFRMKARIIGLIGAFSRIERDFVGSELSLLSTIANHTSLLIENVQLLDAIKRLSIKEPSAEVYDLKHFKDRLSHEKELAEHELEVARKIQMDFLPKSCPKVNDLALGAVFIPAKEVGGDLYDFLDLGKDRLGIVIGDVSGKGVPASLVMVMVRTVLRTTAAGDISPLKVLNRLNKVLCHETGDQIFMSMFYAVWDIKKKILTYASAGQDVPLLFRSEGNQWKSLDSEGIALGVDEDAVNNYIREYRIKLKKGDIIVFYTDGVTDAKNRSDEMFGQERLQSVISQFAAKAKGDLADIITNKIEEFIEDTVQFDDITLIVMAVE